MSTRDLSPIMPALLDALGYHKTAVFVISDRNGEFSRWYANEAAAALLGFTADELAEINPLDSVAADFRASVHHIAANVRAGRHPPSSLELHMARKDGSIVAVDLAIAHVRIADEIVYVVLMRDVGASPVSQLSLLEADRIGLVGALSAGFAHEINNPLTSVLLNLRSLRKQLHQHLPEAALAQALRCLDDVTTGAERIAGNVRALQTLATRSETQQIDLALVVSSALRLAAPTIEPRAQVIRQIAPVRAVTGEESRIGQAVLAMLLFSSSGFSPESTATSNRVVVVVEERGAEVVVEVSDNGRDLSPEEARHAFDPFFRSRARGAGVGVGLGVARSVAATLGGGVTLAPRPSGGVVITMRLPAAPAA
ncbi:MAG: PAS domain S-box protein [Deltaproteobacteria bacterium]|nr:PAS domain S-box protein [Deltaproteobacteria bacterium]MCW5808355.1 PAS domain S-box protein [Deltaproteobacteria bacterium]